MVEWVGHTVVLRGVVATEHDRDLAKHIMQLQPSVGDVDNQIVVAGAGPAGPAGGQARASRPTILPFRRRRKLCG